MKTFSKDYNFVFPDLAETQNCTLIGCGHERVDANYYWDSSLRGKQEFGIWQYTLKGRGVLSLEAKNMT